MNPDYQKYREEINKEAFFIQKKKTRARRIEKAKDYCLMAIIFLVDGILGFIATHFIFKYW
jgi:hypothetical protein